MYRNYCFVFSILLITLFGCNLFAQTDNKKLLREFFLRVYLLRLKSEQTAAEHQADSAYEYCNCA